MAFRSDNTEERRVQITTQEARAGETSGHMRWVLRISLALAVIAGVVIIFSFAG